MKISCGVEISNRSYPAISARNKCKYSVATLALCHNKGPKGQCEDKDAYLILCTQQNLKGTKYKVFKNVEKLFTRFIKDGKATLRIKEPSHDIIISKADPLQLKGFLNAVSSTIIGQGTDKVHFSAAPTKVERPQHKLSITKRKDYPIKSGFSENLKWLQIQQCTLRRIDRRVLNLKNLQVLNLSHNLIKELPAALADMKLKELVLQNNDISSFPVALCTGLLGQNLEVLDLSFNVIKGLSPYFCLMKKLTVLALSYNKLQKLPRNFHQLTSLTMLSASYNEIKVLPFGITKLNLNSLDLFHNPLNTDVVLRPTMPWDLPSLLECAARAVVVHNVPYTANGIPLTLIDYITEHCPCPCGKKVFQKVFSCILLMDLFKLATTVVYINNTSRFKVPLEVYFCSSKCWNRYCNI